MYNINNSNNNNNNNSSNSNNSKISLQETIQNIVKCSICLNSPKNPRFCPRCSALFCLDCIQPWIKTNPTCPNCRDPLTNDNLNSNLIVSNILNELVKSEQEEYTASDICHYHGYERLYYCTTCQEPICSDCALFRHKDHKIEKLSINFNKNLEILKIEEEALKKRQEELIELNSFLELDADTLFKNKSQIEKEISKVVITMKARLKQEFEERYNTILESQERINNELTHLDFIYNDLLNHYKKSPSSFVLTSQSFIRVLQDVHKNSILDIYSPINTELTSELVPPFEHRLLKFENFTSGECLFSSRIAFYGMTWEVKCGIEQEDNNNCFLNLKVLECNSDGKYFYMFTILNQKSNVNKLIEFDLPFQAGETFYIPNFSPKQTLIDEGFILPENDTLLLQFSFRPQNYYCYSNDLKKYIDILEYRHRGYFGEDDDNDNIIETTITKFADRSSIIPDSTSSSNNNNNNNNLNSEQEYEDDDDDDEDQVTTDFDDLDTSSTSVISNNRKKKLNNNNQFVNSSSNNNNNNLNRSFSTTKLYDFDIEDNEEEEDNDEEENSVLSSIESSSSSSLSSSDLQDLDSSSSNGMDNEEEEDSEEEEEEDGEEDSSSSETEFTFSRYNNSNNNNDSKIECIRRDFNNLLKRINFTNSQLTNLKPPGIPDDHDHLNSSIILNNSNFNNIDDINNNNTIQPQIEENNNNNNTTTNIVENEDKSDIVKILENGIANMLNNSSNSNSSLNNRSNSSLNNRRNSNIQQQQQQPQFQVDESEEEDDDDEEEEELEEELNILQRLSIKSSHTFLQSNENTENEDFNDNITNPETNTETENEYLTSGSNINNDGGESEFDSNKSYEGSSTNNNFITDDEYQDEDNFNDDGQDYLDDNEREGSSSNNSDQDEEEEIVNKKATTTIEEAAAVIIEDEDEQIKIVDQQHINENNINQEAELKEKEKEIKSNSSGGSGSSSSSSSGVSSVSNSSEVSESSEEEEDSNNEYDDEDEEEIVSQVSNFNFNFNDASAFKNFSFRPRFPSDEMIEENDNGNNEDDDDDYEINIDLKNIQTISPILNQLQHTNGDLPPLIALSTSSSSLSSSINSSNSINNNNDGNIDCNVDSDNINNNNSTTSSPVENSNNDNSDVSLPQI